MTAGNNGASTPENDDPFGYLYRSEGGDGATDDAGAAPRTGGYGYPGPTGQPGVPRTSYNQVSRVGERQYGQRQAPPQAPGQPYGQQQPNAHYAAPETLSGGAPRRSGPQGQGGGRGPNIKGLLVGAIAVVAVVVVGIGVAMLTNSKDDEKKSEAGDSAPGDSGVDKVKPEKPSGKGPKKFASDQRDGASLRLGGTAAVGREIPNAQSKSGAYVKMERPGDTVTYTVDVPKAGQYTLFTGYGVPGKDTDATLTVNSQPRSQPLKLKNYTGAKEGQWERGWTKRYDWLQLNKGTNTIEFSCGPNDKCNFNLDYVQLKSGQVQD
ncbi:carbohydrate-binding protein [Streptomyces sp. NPDC002055]|uniref:carbohydrate-binding protein n=1 Tax=Streptomyces sp. NPDC002055 TaxID=3154534 RepID=UPI00332052E0